MYIKLTEHLPGDDDHVEDPGYIPPKDYLGCEVPTTLTESDEKGFKLAVNNCLGPVFNVRTSLIMRNSSVNSISDNTILLGSQPRNNMECSSDQPRRYG